MRTKAQQYWDRFLLLLLFDGVSKRRSDVSGNLKAQKLMFLLELAAQRAHRMLGHYRFFRYQYGPFSRDLPEDIKTLGQGQFLHGNRQLTKRGEFLRDYFTESLAGDPSLEVTQESIQQVIQDYGTKSGLSLMNLVYGMSVPVFDFGGEQRKVKDIPSFVDILDPVHTNGLTEVQALPAHLIEDIEAEFAISPDRLNPEHPSYKSAVKRALERITA